MPQIICYYGSRANVVLSNKCTSPAGFPLPVQANGRLPRFTTGNVYQVALLHSFIGSSCLLAFLPALYTFLGKYSHIAVFACEGTIKIRRELPYLLSCVVHHKTSQNAHAQKLQKQETRDSKRSMKMMLCMRLHSYLSQTRYLYIAIYTSLFSFIWNPPMRKAFLLLV